MTTPPCDFDGTPGFSAAEQTNIYAIWRAVAEDFAAFDVDVTTEDPDGWGWGWRRLKVHAMRCCWCMLVLLIAVHQCVLCLVPGPAGLLQRAAVAVTCAAAAVYPIRFAP